MDSFYLILFLLPLPNLWCIWHAYKNTFATPVERVLWMAAGVFLPVVGGIAYLLFGMRRIQNSAAS